MTDRSEETDQQYEGCLSFFDVRGLVPRQLKITVEATSLTGETTTTEYERGLARLIHHEIDHLGGLLYTAHMLPGVDPIPVEEYRQTGRAWAYE
ncbi:peptide deformylase [Streptomyces hygroscopicus]|uniref:peptide deformylase n=1 Tax=Streptomyces hygroscopicus TaxID=1912 RepID=UPI00223F7DD0|nr:peptide deformylase [Streptomyces hygroscopicus]